MTLNPPTEHQLLIFWVALLCLVGAARLLGAVAERFGQPAVIGELGAGLLLGPSVLGRLFPDVADWLFPADDVQTGMLFTVGWLGVVFLLISTGYETDLGLIRRLGAAAAAVAAGSLVVPMAAGFVTGYLLPSTFVGDGAQPLVFALFIAAALSISSLPVIAKILGEMGLMRRNFGQLTLAAGMANDVIGWVLLGIVAGLAQAGGVKVDKLAITIGGLVLFAALAFTIGQRIVDRALRTLKSRDSSPATGLGFVLLVALGFGAFTQALHVEAVLGAFVAGVIFARSRFRDDETMHHLEHLTAAFFAPVFFATVGLRVDLGLLADAEVLAWAVAVVAVASLSKFIGSMIGSRVVGLSSREGAALGIGLNARGALEIVIATVGLSLGVLNAASYTVVVLMAVATSMMAPPLLRRVLSGWAGTPAETERLERERTLASNLVVRSDRLLVPTEGEPTSIMAAEVLDLAWPEGIDVTLVTPEPDSSFQGAARARGLRAVESVFADREVTVERTDDGLVDAVLAEARLGYGAIGVGIGDVASSGPLLPPEVERLITESPVPVVLVRRAHTLDRDLPWAYARAVVPVAGTSASRGAKEIAFNLSQQIGTMLTLTHVVTQPAPSLVGAGGGAGESGTSPRDAGQRILVEATELAQKFGARADARLVEGSSAAAEIMAVSAETAADLLVLGCSRRNAGDGVFLGHTVETVLRHADPTVIVVVKPSAVPGS